MGNTGHRAEWGPDAAIYSARTFMRSVVAEESDVGLLLFDEPSASLDPTAEHDLFAQLRELRGNKTMLFSSHRFGNLTKTCRYDIVHEWINAQGDGYARGTARV